MTNITLILPLLLFFLSIIINLVIITVKMNSSNNNKKKYQDLYDKVSQTIKNLDEEAKNLEDRISHSQSNADNIVQMVDKKTEDLLSKGEELSKLMEVTEYYRSELGQLQVNTNRTHDWVLKVMKEKDELVKLNDDIENFSNDINQIISSYKETVQKQNEYYTQYEGTLEDLRGKSIKEIDNILNEEKASLDLSIKKFNNVVSSLEEKITISAELIEKIDENKKSVDQSFVINLNEIKDQAIIEFENKLNNITSEKSKSYSEELLKINNNKQEEIENAVDNVMNNINELSTPQREKEDKQRKEEKYEVIGEEEEIVLD